MKTFAKFYKLNISFKTLIFITLLISTKTYGANFNFNIEATDDLKTKTNEAIVLRNHGGIIL